MKDYRIIEVKESILSDNDRDADELRKELKSQNTFLLNLMSSPGAGKTTTLVRTISMLKDEMKIGIMEADNHNNYGIDVMEQNKARGTSHGPEMLMCRK